MERNDANNFAMMKGVFFAAQSYAASRLDTRASLFKLIIPEIFLKNRFDSSHRYRKHSLASIFTPATVRVCIECNYHCP